MHKGFHKVFLIFYLFIQLGFAIDCQELAKRLERTKTFNIYEELLYQSEELLKDCRSSTNHSIALNYLLSALETVYQEKVDVDKNLIKNLLDRRMRTALITLRKTSKYRKRHPLLYSYQSLFYVVALENRRVKDYDYALKYAQASIYIGKAILQLRE